MAPSEAVHPAPRGAWGGMQPNQEAVGVAAASVAPSSSLKSVSGSAASSPRIDHDPDALPKEMQKYMMSLADDMSDKMNQQLHNTLRPMYYMLYFTGMTQAYGDKPHANVYQPRSFHRCSSAAVHTTAWWKKYGHCAVASVLMLFQAIRVTLAIRTYYNETDVDGQPIFAWELLLVHIIWHWVAFLQQTTFILAGGWQKVEEILHKMCPKNASELRTMQRWIKVIVIVCTIGTFSNVFKCTPKQKKAWQMRPWVPLFSDAASRLTMVIAPWHREEDKFKSFLVKLSYIIPHCYASACWLMFPAIITVITRWISYKFNELSGKTRVLKMWNISQDVLKNRTLGAIGRKGNWNFLNKMGSKNEGGGGGGSGDGTPREGVQFAGVKAGDRHLAEETAALDALRIMHFDLGVHTAEASNLFYWPLLFSISADGMLMVFLLYTLSFRITDTDFIQVFLYSTWFFGGVVRLLWVARTTWGVHTASSSILPELLNPHMQAALRNETAFKLDVIMFQSLQMSDPIGFRVLHMVWTIDVFMSFVSVVASYFLLLSTL